MSYFKEPETEVQLKVTEVPMTEEDSPIGASQGSAGVKVVKYSLEVQLEVFVPATSQIPFTCH
jgi:hypothetical protein